MINDLRGLLCKSQQSSYGNLQRRQAIREFQQNSDRIQNVVQEMLNDRLFCFDIKEGGFVEVIDPELSHNRVTIIRLWHEEQFSKMLMRVFPNIKMNDPT